MAIQFECPHCKAGYEVADDLAGKMIMCRLCQKRGSVRSLAAKPAPAAATTSNPSRRKFVLIAVASIGSIGTGILLARRPWRLWSFRAERSPEDTTRRRGRRGGGSGRGGPNRKGPPPEQK
ncbi:MAG TPA: hypothetical protein VN688_12870 [Gemmataceae bacterium]|nr:hypothetical protein [Gemmataceae bacterium]